MPRTKRDNLKRSAAQAVNHLASAILDLDSIRQEFEPVHPDKAKNIEQCQLAASAVRDAILAWVENVWALDPETLIKYM